MAESQTPRAAHLFRQRLAQQADRLRRLADAGGAGVNVMNDELRAALPQLQHTLGEPTREKRQRRVRRTGMDGRRSQDLKIRITALDGPRYITTSRVNMSDLRAKGLGRLSESADSIPIEWGERELTSFIHSRYPVLNGIQFEVLIGRSGCKLDAIQDLSARTIKSMKGKGMVRLWVRPIENIAHQILTPTDDGPSALEVPVPPSPTISIDDPGSDVPSTDSEIQILPRVRFYGHRGSRSTSTVTSGNILIADAETEAEYRAATAQMADIIDVAGCSSMALRFQRQERMAGSLTHFILIQRCTEAITQLLEGLEILGLLQSIRANRDISKSLFVKDEQEAGLTATRVERLFDIPEESFCTHGSNRWRAESRTVTHWRNFLMDLEGGQCGEASLNMLLRLVTGSDTIPPLGFAPTPNIAFSHEEDVEEHERRLARISTCDNRLTVPVIRRYRDFKEVLTNTIIMLQIFTDS